jgi:hypothetical protein
VADDPQKDSRSQEYWTSVCTWRAFWCLGHIEEWHSHLAGVLGEGLQYVVMEMDTGLLTPGSPH